jgi:hypothetical protein
MHLTFDRETEHLIVDTIPHSFVHEMILFLLCNNEYDGRFKLPVYNPSLFFPTSKDSGPMISFC